MIKRWILSWSVRRLIYFSLGILMIVLSVKNQMWAGVLFVTYFAVMGFFAFGCAGGQCGMENPGTATVRNDES